MTTNADTLTVYIVDSDSVSRGGLEALVASVGLRVEGYPHIEDFIDSYRPAQPGCLLLDVGSREEAQERDDQDALIRNAVDLPVIVLARDADVPMAVAAMKKGAFEFIEQPYNEQFLLDRVQNALTLDESRRQRLAYRRAVIEHYASLTPREREVMAMVVRGLANKEIATFLDVSRKTVEVHRAKVMSKMQAESFSELIQMALIVGILKEYADENSEYDEPVEAETDD